MNGTRLARNAAAAAAVVVMEMLSRSGHAHPPAADPAAQPTLAPEQVAAHVPEPPSGRRYLAGGCSGPSLG
jgi:hypothetical protein